MKRSRTMTDIPSVKFDDLLASHLWVSADTQGENRAYISRATGQIQWVPPMAEFSDEPPPDDLDDATLYLEVPHRNDLDLGRNLVLDFVDAHLPDAYETVRGMFRQKGAYGRFKRYLDDRGKLEAWHRFEAETVARVLREWCAEQDLPLDP